MTDAVPTIDDSTVFVLRDERPDDRRYVLATWLRAEAESIGHTEGRFFAPWQHAVMEAILARPTTRILIASPQDDDAIAGWCAIDALGTCPVVYYVFVRPEARRCGVAKLLLGQLTSRRDVIYTSRPSKEKDPGGKWIPRGIPIPQGWRYMPRAQLLEVPHGDPSRDPSSPPR